MNKLNVGLLMFLVLSSKVTQGTEERSLSMRLSVKDECLVQIPVVCRVTIKNEGTEKMEVFAPSGTTGTLQPEVRSVGSTDFLPRLLFAKLTDDRKLVTLMPSEEIEGRINLARFFSEDLSVGEYECKVTYCYAPTDGVLIERWSKFHVVEPKRDEDKRADKILTEIKKLLDDSRTNSTEMAVKRLDKFAGSPEAAAAPGYLAQARHLVGIAFLKRGKYLEYASQVEKLRQAPPEWISVEDLALQLGWAYLRGGYYDRAISVLSEFAEQNRTASSLLKWAKRERDELRKNEKTGKDSGEKTTPLTPGAWEHKADQK